MRFFCTLIATALCALIVVNPLQATHNMAGQIQYRQIGTNQIEAVIVTYTFLESRPADRDSLQIDWGDGIIETLIRSNGTDPDGDGIPNGEVVSEIARRNEYRGIHTYATSGQYALSLSDPNRNGGILNVNFPHSEQVLFFIETMMEVRESPEAFNDSPVLLQSPIDMGIVGQPFVHNPDAFDPDGDSLTFELIAPRQGPAEAVRNYVLPDAVEPGPGNQISIDPVTGTLIWDAPQRAGTYNIAILVKSYRDGQVIDQTIRDMQVIVQEMGLVLPEVEVDFAHDQTYEVEVGQTVDIQISARSFNDSDSLGLVVSSGLLELGLIHELFVSGDVNAEKLEGQLRWHVDPSFLREQPYTFVFKVRESKDQMGWAAIRVVRYKVVNSVVSTRQETIDEQLIELFPNPTRDLLTVNNLTGLGELEYEVHGTAGRKLFRGVLGDDQSEIDVSGLVAGTYMIRFWNDAKVLTKTFVKR